MQNVSVTGREFSNLKPGDKDIQQLFQNSFQIWQSENSKLERIVLRFSGRAVQLVRERNWHPSQRLQDLADGNLEVTLDLNSLEEVQWSYVSNVLQCMFGARRVPFLASQGILSDERRGD